MGILACMNSFVESESSTLELHSILEWHFLCPMCTHWHLAAFDAVGMVFLKINVIFMSTRPWGIHPYQMCYNRLNIVRDMSVHRVCLQNIGVHIRVPKSFHCDKLSSCSILNMSLVNCTFNTAIRCTDAHKCPCNV